MEPPVLLLVFNRPELTVRVLRAVREAKPRNLIVAADGLRVGNDDDAELCHQVREIVREEVDWDTNLYQLYADQNLGCRERIISAIDFVLNKFDRVIILEDDCVPHPSFFEYCRELLDRYAADEQISMIGGNNFLPDSMRPADSYYFSRHNATWGWATWRRAWRHNDPQMRRWPALREAGWLGSVFSEPLEAAYWKEIFDRTYVDERHIWDYQWQFSCWLNKMLAVTPSVNLVSNVGYGLDATHTIDYIPEAHDVLASEMKFPIVHPNRIERDTERDAYVQRKHYGRAKDPSFLGRIRRLAFKIRRGWRKHVLCSSNYNEPL